jgi:secreted Zn-dependent insulinase-like peptidase
VAFQDSLAESSYHAALIGFSFEVNFTAKGLKFTTPLPPSLPPSLPKVAFQDSLAEFSYPAALAGLSYEVDFTAKGLRLAVGGYHDKLPQYTR